MQKAKLLFRYIRCNQRMKFRDLLNTSLELGAEMLVTGHYAEIRNN